MTKETLRALTDSFANRKSVAYRAFRNAVITECGISYPTFDNYRSLTRPCKIPKLVGEKIIEIVRRDYPEKLHIIEQM